MNAQIKSNQIRIQTQSSTSTQNLENNSKPINYLPWVLGGVGLVSLVGIAVYFLTKKNKEIE